jgi:hypothetical protein
VHVTPQPPQFVESICSSTHTPLHIVALTQVQPPFWQVGADPGHWVPHWPQ